MSSAGQLIALYSNCCYMLGYLSLRYRCSGSKFCFLLWVEIDRNIFETRNYELHLRVAFIGCHKTSVKPSYICKSSLLSIGSSIGEVGFLLLHHLYTILGSKNWFPSKESKWMVAKTSLYHSSSHPSTKKSHKIFCLIWRLLTIWVSPQ